MTRFNVSRQSHNVNPELRYLGPLDYRITDRDGLLVGSPSQTRGWVLVADAGARMFKRNAIHSNGATERWLVAELNGVRLYVDPLGQFILSDKDIYPDSTDTIAKLKEGGYPCLTSMT